MVTDISDVTNQLKDLLDRKSVLLENLVEIQNKFNELESTNNDNWLYDLSIKNLNDLNNNPNTLKDFKSRIALRKSSIKTLNELDILDSLITVAKCELLTAKINSILS